MPDEQSTRPEDEPRTLIFVDMLGFADLTRRNPTRVVHYGPDGDGFAGSATTALQSRVVRFQRILEHVLNEQTLQGGASAMIFSDCANIDVPTSLRAARVAIDLMLLFNKADVPVRMGLGRGTFYGFKYSVDVSGSDMVTKALFAGTAVVNAHGAETCGARGCRILLHPLAEEDLRRKGSHPCLVALPEKLGLDVVTEVCYLPDDIDDHDQKPYADRDLQVIRHVRQMEADSEPLEDKHRLQYVETHSAIDRMRTAMHRGTTLEQAEKNEAEYINELLAIADATAGD
jgi:hypothetical protein